MKETIRIKDMVKFETKTGVVYAMVLKFEEDNKFLGVVQLDTSTDERKPIGHRESYELKTVKKTTFGEMVRTRDGGLPEANNKPLKEPTPETTVEGLGDTDKDVALTSEAEPLPIGDPELTSPSGLTQVATEEEKVEGEKALEEGFDPDAQAVAV